MIRVAHLMSERGTCARRQVGCVLTTEKNIVLATGYNGVPANWEHCRDRAESNAGLVDHFCADAPAASGEDLDFGCIASHAEENALRQCTRPEEIHTCYSTVSPCVRCTVALLSTPCQRLVFSVPYEAHWNLVRRMWRHARRSWEILKP